jgi:hypothetical protein
MTGGCCSKELLLESEEDELTGSCMTGGCCSKELLLELLSESELLLMISFGITGSIKASG